MTRPRSQLISLSDTPYYHCVCRCVRRAFLCGSDGNQCYEHRRQWVSQRIKQLASIFTIDIASYAVMSNHYHLVVRVDADIAQTLTDTEVIKRWLKLFQGPPIIHRHLQSPFTSFAELSTINDMIAQWRERLYDLSWFMRCLNEHIARLANAEDHCSGHFWESRFKSQALLDETALLTCMAYVDLNPIRASMADTPEASDFTSIKERLGASRITLKTKTNVETKSDDKIDLMPFAGSLNKTSPDNHLPFTFCDYLELVDWSGRIIREDKRGYIPSNTPPILQRLNIDPKQWLTSSTHIEREFYLAIGPITRIEQFTQHLKQQWIKGIGACRQLYSPT